MPIRNIILYFALAAVLSTVWMSMTSPFRYILLIGQIAACIMIAREIHIWLRDRKRKIKMYCIVAKESLDLMKGIRGKMMTQSGHAYLHSYWDAVKRFPRMARAYRDTSHAYKITLVVPTVADLQKLWETYYGVCGVSMVTDAGFTVFKGATTTCLGLGPIFEEDIGEDLRAIKTLT